MHFMLQTLPLIHTQIYINLCTACMVPYPMTRQASGTSWVPDSFTTRRIHILCTTIGFLWLWGFNYFITDVQHGKRGNKQLFDSNMFMFMGQKDFDKSTLAFRTMFSLEPLTIGKKGYPSFIANRGNC